MSAVNDQAIAGYSPLESGAVLNLQTLPTRSLNIQAFTAPTAPGSVVFQLDDAPRAIESVAPYALAGDENGHFRPWTPTVGSHTLRVTAYTDSGASGTAGPTVTLSFSVTDAASTSPPASTAPSTPNVIRIDAGSSVDVRDAAGNTWAADKGLFTPTSPAAGGSPSQPVAGTLADAIYSTNRANMGSATPLADRGFTYRIPTTATRVDVRLLFDESYWTTPGKRQFDVYAENTKAISALDLFAAAGAKDTAFDKTISGVAVSGGALDLRFQALTDFPMISGIQVTCTAGCATTPAPTDPEPSLPGPPPWPTKWTSGVSGPGPRYEAAVARVGDKIYAFGGYGDAGYHVLRSYISYDLATQRWTTLGTMPAGVAETHLGITTNGRDIYLLGGFAGDLDDTKHPSQQINDQVWRLDTVTNSWTYLTRLPAPRGAGGAALIGNELHYVGGNLTDRTTNTGTHYVLNLDSGAWRTGAPLPDPRDHFSMKALGGLIYVLGGEHSHDAAHIQQKTGYVYSPTYDAWTRIADSPVAKSHVESATFISDGKIVMAGGQIDDAQPTAGVIAYEPATNAWHTLPNLPVMRQGAAIQRAGDRMVISLGAVYASQPQSATFTASLP